MDLSTFSLLSGIAIACLGAGLFLYGKNMQRMAPLGVGLAMCVYPYSLPVLIMWIVAIILLVVLYMISCRLRFQMNSDLQHATLRFVCRH